MNRRRRFRLSVEPLEGRIALSDCDGMDAADWVAEMPTPPDDPIDDPAMGDPFGPDTPPIEPDPPPFGPGPNPPGEPLPPAPIGPAGPAL